MLQAHTQEPWDGDTHPLDSSPNHGVVKMVPMEDYQRAKACVNACAGIPTLELNVAQLTSAPKNIVEKQRDALLDALKISSIWIGHVDHTSHAKKQVDVFKKLIAAIESGKVPT